MKKLFLPVLLLSSLSVLAQESSGKKGAPLRGVTLKDEITQPVIDQHVERKSSKVEDPELLGLMDSMRGEGPKSVGRTWGQSFREKMWGVSAAVKSEIDSKSFDVANKANAGNRLNWALLDNMNKEQEAINLAVANFEKSLSELRRVQDEHLAYTKSFTECAQANKLEINASEDVDKHLRALKSKAMVQLYDHILKSQKYLEALKQQEDKIRAIGRIERPVSPTENYGSVESLVARAKSYHLASEALKKQSEKK